VSIIWNKLIACQNEIISTFQKHCEEIEEPGLDAFHQPDNGWINRVFSNQHVRRAHIDVVDARDTKGLWMMHVCVFPVLNNPSPIYGFDVIAGKNKITGAFHDFSPSAYGLHPMLTDYFNSVKDFVPKKQRELPAWAKRIFTDKMLAAGNVNTDEEADQIISIATNNLHSYMENVGTYTGYISDNSAKVAQNHYCNNQKQNPHTPKVMKSLGLDEEMIDTFCKDMLFPNIE